MRRSSQASEAFARLVAAGPSALDDLEAVELAAGLSAERAAAVFAEFGSLAGALGASQAALGRCVPRAEAARIVLLGDIACRLLRAPLKSRPALRSSDGVADYLRAVLGGLNRERLCGLFLDRGARLIRDEVLAEGTFDHLPIYPREIIRRALELDAAAVVVAHNKTGGEAAPSQSVVDATRQVVEAGRHLRITVADHFVLADGRVRSFRALGLL